jgi:transcriptional regulator with XRE-family HTH domain
MSLGSRIKQLRLAKGWSQETTADKLKLGLQAYSKIERDITDITLSRLAQIAKLFNVSPPELLDSQIEVLKKEIAKRDTEIAQLQKELLVYLKKNKK